MKTLLLSFFLLKNIYANSSCEEKLLEKTWPLDCFLALEIKKTPTDSKAYRLLDDWCLLYQDELVINEPPEAIFSLFLPKNCLKSAIKSQSHHNSLKLLSGRFLNSFL